ncbi:RNA polymerase sigma factor [Candidatus Clostridium radicumherbarum]|uniref:RNA polymerase sigma factor n=1 Tax=Candidatus Clostridium radicumherbarum TaxID=3381662 RepID=A0ABW8TWY9_9CLOT
MFEGIWEKEKIEEAEFIELLDMRITILYKIAFSYFKDENDASDAVQDTVIIAYKNYYKLKDRNKYIVCYLSSGEEVSFKVNDMKNMKSLCKVITINKDFQKDGEKIRVRTFTKGVTYGNLYIVSDLGFYESEVSIFIDGKEYKNLPASAAGGEENYNTPPIGDNKTYVKIKVKNTGKEYKVDIQ